MVFLCCKIIGIFIFFTAFAQAEQKSYYETPRTKVEAFLVPPSSDLQSNAQKIRIGFYFELAKGWHIYWKNPGDSGTAPRIDAGESTIKDCEPLEFLTPERIVYGPLTTYGFSHETMLFSSCGYNKKNNARIRIKFSWLVCEDTCIPESSVFEIDPLSSEHDWPRWQQRVATAEASSPKKPANDSIYDIQGKDLYLSMPATFSLGSDSYFFPETQNLINANSHQEWKLHGDRILGKIEVSESNSGFTQDLQGVFVAGKTSIEVHANRASIQKPQESTLSWWIFYLAFLGGLILNLMPCVFPVLSLKIMALTTSSENHLGHLRDSIFYSIGVLITVLGMGGTLLLLKLGGHQSGWGMQLQQPIFVTFLYFLFLSMGLYFIGIWGFKGTLLSPMVRFLEKGSRTSSILNGILTTLVATPCTAPFMGVSLGVAFVLPFFQAMLVFFALGLGLSFPILVLGIFPRALGFLPRPGKWMETLKKILSVPLLLTCLWLLWVLEAQTSKVTVAIIMANSLILVFAIKYFSRANFSQNSLWRWIGFSAALLGIVVGSISLSNRSTSLDQITGAWQPFSMQKIQAWESLNESYFIDFTARWCITCQVNKKLVLEQDDIQKLFSENKVNLMRADWTNQDPEITKLLNKYGRAGVPMYLFKKSGQKEAQVLPEVLTKATIEKIMKEEN